MRQYINTIPDAEAISISRALGYYVRGVLEEKRLSLHDVKIRAGSGISDSHLCNILAGKARNLSVSKIKALARGLGVAEEQVFEAASGSPLVNWREYQESDFRALFRKHAVLTGEDCYEISRLLRVLSHEIQRLHTQAPGPTQSPASHNLNHVARSCDVKRKEDIKLFILRVLAEKRLTLKEVERRSKGQITSSYIDNIKNGIANNPTIEKILGLAEGLGVARQEIFSIFCRCPVSEYRAFQQSDYAKLYRQYEELSNVNRREMRSLLSAIDRETDWRHMRIIRMSNGRALQEL